MHLAHFVRYAKEEKLRQMASASALVSAVRPGATAVPAALGTNAVAVGRLPELIAPSVFGGVSRMQHKDRVQCAIRVVGIVAVTTTTTSVAAPTYNTATPPANLAKRSCNFSLS